QRAKKYGVLGGDDVHTGVSKLCDKIEELEHERNSAKSLPQVTHVSFVEGGNWHEWDRWQHGEPLPQHQNVFALKFNNGWIWDVIVGWRPVTPDTEAAAKEILLVQLKNLASVLRQLILLLDKGD